MGTSVSYNEISDDNAGQRLDNYLIKVLKGVPKSLIYKIIRKGEVRVNKGRAKPDQKLCAGDIVRVPPVRLADRSDRAKPSQQLMDTLKALHIYEDDELLVINKPCGLAVHAGSGIDVGMIEALRELHQQTSLELVHRLDRATSGCVMVAKNRRTLNYLQDLLRARRKIDKIYAALVHGQWPQDLNEVRAPLLKNEPEGGERIVVVDAHGKEALTEFSVIQNHANATLIEARPITGRTHQIRVHAASSGYALVGDDKYTDNGLLKNTKSLGLRRLFLHARKLRIPFEDGRVIEVEAELPAEFTKAAKLLG